VILWLDGAIFLLAIACAVVFQDIPARCYFAVLALCQPFLALTYGTEEYPLVYYPFTAVLLLLGLWVALDVLPRSHTKWMIVLLAAFVSGVLFHYANKEAYSLDSAATVVEETLLGGYGIVVGLSAPNCRQKILYGSLALAWILQAGFGFGYMLHIGSRAWYLSNQFVPAFINIALFAWMLFYVAVHRTAIEEP
jgi:hypothetical protein